jgi:hypothetical protein
VHYLAQKEYLARRWDFIPIFTPLRFAKNFPDTDSLILHQIFTQYKLHLSHDAYYTFRDTGKFLVLLDAFDEIDTTSDAKSRAKMFVELSSIFTSNSPMILTCRDVYFTTREEYNKLVDTITYNSGTLSGYRIGSATAQRIASRLYRRYVDEKVPPRLRETHAVLSLWSCFHTIKLTTICKSMTMRFRTVFNAIGEKFEITLRPSMIYLT